MSRGVCTRASTPSSTAPCGRRPSFPVGVSPSLTPSLGSHHPLCPTVLSLPGCPRGGVTRCAACFHLCRLLSPGDVPAALSGPKASVLPSCGCLRGVGAFGSSVRNYLFIPERWHLGGKIIIFSAVVLGDITQKGYEKKRAKLLARYIPLLQGKVRSLTRFLKVRFLTELDLSMDSRVSHWSVS